jgi:hypothetical protein
MPSNCANCGISYAVEPEEQEWIAANSKETPTLCPRCRAFKTGVQDESITCTMCGKVFIFPRELRLFARMFSWTRPRRCIGGCRTQSPPLNEAETVMSDFLRRLRSTRRAHSTGLSLRSSGGSAGVRSTSGSSRRGQPGGDPIHPGEEGLGDSLAQALKEFKEKKRRGRHR